MEYSSSRPRPLPNRTSSPQRNDCPAETYHRVYILSCAHCGCFVSDRGMKAVLLLRPSITLFSTDGMPYNCGPLYPDGDDDMGYSEQVERTCDCLTQSIGCFGCGNTIGYHIICPCTRCVDSVSKHRRAANGHRWVFHYGEVTSQERCYVANEPGIHNAPQSNNRALQSSSSMGAASSSASSSSTDDRWSEDSRERELAKPDLLEGFEFADGIYDLNMNLIHSHVGGQFSRRSRSVAHNHKPALKQGDPVYWHHLISTGERPLPIAAPCPLITSRPAR